MSEICVVFEREQSSDSDDVKKQRHEEILDLMERMQNLGQPPKDIVEDMVSCGANTNINSSSLLGYR